MSEQRLIRIEERLDTQQAEMRTGFDELRTGSNEMRADINALRAGLDELRADHKDHVRQTGVMHEEVLDRIAPLAPDFRPIRREVQTADAELKENIERRLEPIEAAVKAARPRRRR